MKKVLMFVLLMLLMLNIALAIYPLHVLPLNTTNHVQANKTFSYTFNLTLNNDCTNVIYSNTTILRTNINGMSYIDLFTDNLLTPPRRLCEYRNGTLRRNHTIPDGFFHNVLANNNIITSQNVTSQTYKLNGTTGIEIQNFLSTWFAKFRDGIGVDNTGLFFNISGGVMQLKYVNYNGWSADINGNEVHGLALLDYDPCETYRGVTNTGQFCWDQSANYFFYPNNLLASLGTNHYFRDLQIGIGSNDDGHLDLTADEFIDLNVPLVNVTKNLRVTGNFTGNQIYGFMYVHNESNADTVITSANTYYNISENVKAGQNNGFRFVNDNALITEIPGVYLINYHIGFRQVSGAGDEWHFVIGLNGAAQNLCHTPRKINTITDFGSAGATCILRLATGDLITGMIENQNDADDARIMDMQVSLARVGN